MSTVPLGEIIKTKTYIKNNVNVNNINYLNNVNNVTGNRVKLIANRLAERLKDPGSMNFYYKVAWRLPESIIWNNLEQAEKGRNPAKYFTFLCSMDLNS